MTYVVQIGQDGHTTAGLETYTMLKYAPISYVVQKARERPTKQIPHRARGLRNRRTLNRRQETKTRQVWAKLRKRGRLNRHKQEDGTVKNFRPGYENKAS